MKLNWRLVARCGSPVRQRRCVFWQSLQYQDDQGLTAPGRPVSVAPGYRVGSRPQRGRDLFWSNKQSKLTKRLLKTCLQLIALIFERIFFGF